MRQLPGIRLTNLLGLIGCITAMVYAVGFLQYYLDLEPCPLCIFDRVVVIALGICFLVAALHNPTGVTRRVYAGLCTLISLIGVGIASRHVWLQNLPADQVPSCGPGLDYMLETLPIMETLSIVFTGSGECADIKWSLFGLSIPVQTLIVFLGFAGLSLFQLLRPARPTGTS